MRRPSPISRMLTDIYAALSTAYFANPPYE